MVGHVVLLMIILFADSCLVEAGKDLNCARSIPPQACGVLARACSALPRPLYG